MRSKEIHHYKKSGNVLSQEDRKETYKNLAEISKHSATLSTTVIGFIAVLLEKVFNNVNNSWLVYISLGVFYHMLHKFVICDSTF